MFFACFFQMNQLLQKSKEFHITDRLVFSPTLIPNLENIFYRNQKDNIKPYGLWYSWGSSWLDYLNYPQSNGWWTERLNSYKHIYQIILNYKKIILIKEYKDFQNFTNLFGVQVSNSKLMYPYRIKWRHVASHFAGIDIRFNQDADTNFYWYKGWDCSSGCIWNKIGLAKIRKIY